MDRSKTPDIDLIARHKDLKLVALFAAEHGIRGTDAAGAHIDDEVDSKTGVPVYSLYGGEDRGPTPEMLKDVAVALNSSGKSTPFEGGRHQRRIDEIDAD